MSHETSWWELSLEVPAPLADDICGMLLYNGALGADLTSHDLPAPPCDGKDPLSELKKDHTIIRTSFDAKDPKETVLEMAQTALGELGLNLAELGGQLRKRDDTDWAESWKSFFKPLAFGEKLWVLPRWETEEENETMLAELSLNDDAIVVHLEPGLAFGTGQHETTALCLSILAKRLQDSPERMVDVGCGSGILSIAAAKLGVPQILALDNDPLAVKICRENAEANGVASQIISTEEPIQNNSQRFELVLANIIAPVLIQLAAGVVNAIEPGGSLVLSGMLESQVQSVKDAYCNINPRLEWIDEQSQGEWHALIATLPL